MSNAPRVLFVCLGNICRSPAAEGVLRGMAKKAGKTEQLHVASAGTSAEHAGDLPDSRMRRAALRRGYDLVSRARQFRPEDFDAFDLIVPMDEANRQGVLRHARSEEDKAKVRPMATYFTRHSHTHVPDPWYGGPEGFEEVLDLLEDGCLSLLLSLSDAKQAGFKPYKTT